MSRATVPARSPRGGQSKCRRWNTAVTVVPLPRVLSISRLPPVCSAAMRYSGRPRPTFRVVRVVVKGSLRNHAVTDLQGRYSIRVPSSTDTLQFTYLGYKPLERVVGSRTRLDVEMLSESQQVDAVVVTALGLTRKEKSLGYAVSTVGSEDLNNTVTNNWLNGMAGKVAGLNFDTSSAGPGGSIRVTLRGEGSLA